MTIQTDGYYRVSAIMADQVSGEVVNVFHLRCDDDNAETQILLRADIAEYIESVYTFVFPYVQVRVLVDRIEIYNAVTGDPEGVVAWPTLLGGSAVGEALPSGVAALTSARTGVARKQGRKYWPVFTEDANNDGTWSAAVQLVLANTANQWIAPFLATNGSTWTPGIVDRVTLLFYSFTEAVIRSIPAYQRRRKTGVGS